MTINFAQPIVVDRLEALTRGLDAASSPGKINIYSSPRPAPGAAITSQTLLASVSFQKPSSGGVVGNTLTLNYVVGPVLAVGTGEATWARFVSGAGTYVADMDVSLEKDAEGNPGPGEIHLDVLQIYAGGSVTVKGVASLQEL